MERHSMVIFNEDDIADIAPAEMAYKLYKKSSQIATD